MVQCVGWSILKWSLSIVEVALSSLFYAPPFEKVAFTLPTAWEQVWEGHPPPPPREAVPCPNAPSFGGRRSHPEQGHRSIYPGRQHPAFGRWRPPWCASPGSATGAPCTTRVRGAERSGGIRGIPILRELLRSRGRHGRRGPWWSAGTAVLVLFRRNCPPRRLPPASAEGLSRSCGNHPMIFFRR